MIRRILQLIFPPKCTLCQKILLKNETDLCQQCRSNAPEYLYTKKNIPFIAGWTALWYYKGNARESLLRYKFHNARSYGPVYGRLLAMKLLTEQFYQFDILSWVPISAKRKQERGFDQVECIAYAMGRELGVSPVKTLKKIRNNKTQSTLIDASHRRANVLGAYCVCDPQRITGKRILLLDDIITTGSTVSECAKTLLMAGAKEVYCAAVAATPHEK